MMDLFEPEWLLRLAAATLTGALIGYERFNRAKEAGIRTHAIVALASCLLMIISEYAFADAAKNDPARIAAQAVSGISFLGAGIIFIQKGSVQGLTTAAGIWATAAIGLAYGAAMYKMALIAGLLVFVIQMFLPRVLAFNLPRNVLKIRAHLGPEGKTGCINEALKVLQYNHTENLISKASDGWIIETEISSHRDIDPNGLIRELEKDPRIDKVEII